MSQAKRKKIYYKEEIRKDDKSEDGRKFLSLSIEEKEETEEEGEMKRE